MKGIVHYLAATLIGVTLASCSSQTKREKAIEVPAPIAGVDTTQALASLDKTDSSNTFSWSTEVCRNRGIFNPNVYSAQQLKDTYYLWFQFNSVLELEDVTLDSSDEWTIENINSKSAKLDSDYRKATNRLKSLQLIPSSFWRTIKELKTKELDELYTLSKLTIEAYRTPTVLLSNSYSVECKEYVNALASEDSVALFAAWKSLTEKEKKRNLAPERLETKFQEQRNSPERLNYAKISLMTFGWWNCANNQRKYNSLYQDKPMEEEFNKLFIKITNVECDDVD